MRVISLDFAGIIAPKDFIDYFWFVALPRRIAKLEKVSLYEAMKFVEQAYESIPRSTLEWYLPQYWASRFGIEHVLEEAILESLDYAEVYGDASEVIPILGSRYTLIVATNTTKDIIDAFLEKYSVIRKYVKRVYSCIDDVGSPRKNVEFYKFILDDVGAEPWEVVHIGDDPIYDGEIPQSLGIRTIVVERHCKRGSCIRDLYQVLEVIWG